jgi:E3 ubiquitin-protein ligase RAD18
MEEVSDPSDWKATEAPFLRAIEESLRCHICKEYFTAPMITSCCHTFCSLCIRRQLDLDSRCPSCRKEIQLSSLRKNAAIEETTELYKESRNALLKVISARSKKEQTQPRRDVKQRSQDDEKDENNQKQMGTDLEESEQSEDIYVIDSSEESQPPTKKLRSNQEVADGDYGHCPVCNEFMKIKDIESKHIAGCLARHSVASARPKRQFLRKQPTASHSMQKLPSIAYSLMTERKLRDLVRDLGIPFKGDKQTLEKRHKEWINLWNANVDSKIQKTKTDLLAELDGWERTADVITTPSADIKKIDTKAWNSTHSSDFRDLIAAARQSRGRKNETAEAARRQNDQEKPVVIDDDEP